ncbi:MAG: hypothetical protein HN396_16080 [Gemmatimonadales bacterium]|nr:hypothetical protein [Gemmatimonadales bacterium]
MAPDDIAKATIEDADALYIAAIDAMKSLKGLGPLQGVPLDRAFESFNRIVRLRSLIYKANGARVDSWASLWSISEFVKESGLPADQFTIPLARHITEDATAVEEALQPPMDISEDVLAVVGSERSSKFEVQKMVNFIAGSMRGQAAGRGFQLPFGGPRVGLPGEALDATLDLLDPVADIQRRFAEQGDSPPLAQARTAAVLRDPGVGPALTNAAIKQVAMEMQLQFTPEDVNRIAAEGAARLGLGDESTEKLMRARDSKLARLANEARGGYQQGLENVRNRARKVSGASVDLERAIGRGQLGRAREVLTSIFKNAIVTEQRTAELNIFLEALVEERLDELRGPRSGNFR